VEGLHALLGGLLDELNIREALREVGDGRVLGGEREEEQEGEEGEPLPQP
jgi:hypothetical protein